MNSKIKMLGVWSGVAFFVLWVIGFCVLARWIPPVSPAIDAQGIADMFRLRSVSIRMGMVFMTVGSVFYLPWTAMISDLIKPIEGKSSFLSGTQLAAGVVGQLTFFIPAYFWAVAAFRPERSPEITQAIDDLGWFMFMTPIGPFMLQYLILAVAIFIDRRPEPAFPRWVGFLQIWVSISFIPALLAFFMKTGPFAWNGLFVWWIPASLFAVWFCVMVVLCRKAVLREALIDL